MLKIKDNIDLIFKIVAIIGVMIGIFIKEYELTYILMLLLIYDELSNIKWSIKK